MHVYAGVSTCPKHNYQPTCEICLHMQDIRVYLRLGTTPDERYARADYFFFLSLASRLPVCQSMVRLRIRDRRRVQRRGVSRSHSLGERLRKRRHVCWMRYRTVAVGRVSASTQLCLTRGIFRDGWSQPADPLTAFTYSGCM
jgi:hypothetical protein